MEKSLALIYTYFVILVCNAHIAIKEKLYANVCVFVIVNVKNLCCFQIRYKIMLG